MISKNDIVQVLGSPNLYCVVKVERDSLIVAHKTDNNIAVKLDDVVNHWALQG
jgi:hypothetical protein